MRKSGLHKQVASIFEGVPASGQTPAADTAQTAANPPQTRGFHPDRIVPRPKPAPKATAAAAEPGLRKKTGRTGAKKKPTGADAENARRQKIMTILVGVLSVVFVGVIAISFGGIGQSKPAPPAEKPADTAEPVSKFDPETWVFPVPLPTQMRNPMVVPTSRMLLEGPGAETEPEEGPIVRGIVYSDNKTSAIIDDQVMVEGQTFREITVVKISRNTVEFEKDGKRWIQHVQ